MNEKIKLIEINQNPFDLFDKWFVEAKQKEINDHNAMNIATVNKNHSPSSRMVLLKSYDVRGFVFFTNMNSRKGIEINNNKKISLNFHWKSILKQVRIEGRASKVSNKESDDYFDSRSRNSKIGAWASKQSSELIKRDDLINKFNDYKIKFRQKGIPRPVYWSGYRIKPILIEFWQDMEFRLHDRVEFKKINNKWIGKRLNP